MVYPVFRDKVLLQGLREFRAQELGVSIDQVPEMKYMWTGANQTHKNGEQSEISPRAVLEWVGSYKADRTRDVSHQRNASKCSVEARAQKKQKTAEKYGQMTLWAFVR